MKRGIDLENQEHAFEKRFSKILDFFSGVFFSVSIIGAVFCFFMIRLLYSDLFAILISISFFCIFMFFGLISKSLALLLKKLP